MDNIFELLILFIFIVSAFKTLFGQKKKRRADTENQESDVPPQRKKNDQEDILETLFGIPSPKQENDPFEEPYSQKQQIPSQQPSYETSWNPEDDFKDSNEVEKEKHTSKYKKLEDYNNINLLEKFSAKSKVEKAEPLISQTQTTYQVSKKNKEIKEMLKNPKTIRNSVLIAEILNKPKALRYQGEYLHR